MSSTPRILLVDDDPFTLVMLMSTLKSIGFADVVAVRSANEAVAETKNSPPDVAILDLDLGEGPTGIDLAYRLRELVQKIGIIILSTYAEPRLIGTKQRQLPPNSQYIVKQSISDNKLLAEAIANCVDGTSAAATSHSSLSPIAGIKDTQVEVMRLIASGMSNAKIAEELFMQEASVEKAIARLIKQLNIKASSLQNQRVLITQEYYRLTKGANESRK